MATSKIPFTVQDFVTETVDISDCSTLESIFNLLEQTPNNIGVGGIGSGDSTNLYTLLSSPGIGTWGDCFIKLLNSRNSGVKIAIAIAHNVTNTTATVKVKFLLRLISSQGYQQTGWFNISG